MSNGNLHTCDKAASGWQRDGHCQECENLSASNDRLSFLFKTRVKIDEPVITAIACPPSCEHKWDGPIIDYDDGHISSRTCSLCGIAAIDHDTWMGV